MAQSILITGIPGSGKSSACSELIKQGHRAYSIEDMTGMCAMVDKKTGKVIRNHNNDSLEEVKAHEWVCDKEKLRSLIETNKDGVAYYCGTAGNIDDLLPLFDKVVLLRAEPETIRKRLQSRKSQDFGNTPEVQELVLKWKDWWEGHVREQGVIVVDANQDLAEMVADIIERAMDKG